MILIIGAGFIGKSIFDDLTNKGYKVKLFSRNLNIINSKYCDGDINEIDKYADFFDDVTTIIHAVHTTVPATSYENEIFDIETNVIPFIKLIKLCKKKEVKKFIYISTGGAIYGSSNENEIKTEDSITNPSSSYGITKLTNEKYLMIHKKSFTNGLFILRPSNIYGIGQSLARPQGIIMHLINNIAVNNTSIEIWGNGEGKKDYLYISDFTSGIQKIVDSTKKQNKCVFNISFGQTESINNIIKVIESASKCNIKIKHVSTKQFDMQNIELDSYLFRKTYNWHPLYNVEKGIKAIINSLNKK